MVYYIYHSAFVIELKKSILIFDFYRFPSNKKKEKEEFFNRFIKRTDKKVYVFSTHSHSDHFNKEILTWLEMNENIKYILSDDIKIHKHKNFYFTKEDDNFELDNLKIRTFGSTDLGSSFYVNTEDKNISVWLGDLGRIPLEEQRYWKIYNIRPKGRMDEKFIDRQINVKWTTPSRIEQELLLKIGEFNKNIEKIYDINKIFSDLKKADKEIYNSFILPINSSVEGYKEFLMKLTKITTESINQKEIKKKLPDETVQDLNNKGSI